MESKKPEENKLWTQQEIDAKVKEFDDKIEAAKRDDNTTNVSPDTIKVEKGVFLKDKAKDYDKAEEVLRDALTTAVGPNGKLEIVFEILQMTIQKLEV